MEPGIMHLTADDLDAFLEGRLDQVKLRHLDVCEPCHQFALAEQRLAARLAALPLFSPAQGFADRVMASVRTGAAPVPSLQRYRRKLFASRKSSVLAAGLAAAVLGSMGASVAWTLGHQQTLAALGQWLGAQAGEWLWVGVRGAASNLIEQPWYDGVRSFLGSPARLAAASGSLSLVYLTGVLALRRLMALPTARVAHAGA